MQRKIQLRHQFPENYDTNAATDEAGLDTGQEGGAKQSFKEECDINTLVKRFGIGYEMPAGLRAPEYGDFTGISDFHQALNAVAKTRETFDALPADVRSRFANNPGEFADFALNPVNREQLKKWGMLSPEAIQRDQEAAQAAAAAPSNTPLPTRTQNTPTGA